MCKSYRNLEDDRLYNSTLVELEVENTCRAPREEEFLNVLSATDNLDILDVSILESLVVVNNYFLSLSIVADCPEAG